MMGGYFPDGKKWRHECWISESEYAISNEHIHKYGHNVIPIHRRVMDINLAGTHYLSKTEVMRTSIATENERVNQNKIYSRMHYHILKTKKPKKEGKNWMAASIRCCRINTYSTISTSWSTFIRTVKVGEWTLCSSSDVYSKHYWHPLKANISGKSTFISYEEHETDSIEYEGRQGHANT